MACASVIQAPSEYCRSFDAIAAAFQEASRDRHTEVMAVLALREHEIDTPAVWLAMRSLVGLLARQTGRTPRSILDAEFASAPSDDVWDAFGGHASDRLGDTPAEREGALALPRFPDVTGRPAGQPLD